MKDADQLIKEINQKLEELEGKPIIEEEPIIERNRIDQTATAIKTIRECVTEVLNIKDLKASRKENEKIFDNRLLTIVSWFNYLKKEKSTTAEYEEAKTLVQNIGKQHPQLEKWCERIIERPIR